MHRLYSSISGLLVSLMIHVCVVGTASAASLHALANSAPAQEGADSRDLAREYHPADVHARTLVVRDELDLIRIAMGKPVVVRPEIAVNEAAPHEVFFQALTLFRKADRLCFEWTSDRSDAPAIPQGDIAPAQVYAVVDAALERLRRVKLELGITRRVPERAVAMDRTPTDVFRSIVQANRQLNLLLERRFSPSDVYQQVSLALAYSTRLRARAPGRRMPETPAFESNKTPGDVYDRLVDCLSLLRRVGGLARLPMLELDSSRSDGSTATPSDVYDLASMAVSDLRHLVEKLDGPVPALDVYYPGHKLPAHVYQRVGILEAQLREFEALARADPRLVELTD